MKFSIVTPSYNSALFLNATIQSIKEQTYQDFEHIVIDGGSTDGTIELLHQYPHLKWVSEPDNGQSDAINKGFRLATGDILAWQNADDLYFPNTFQVVADFFKQNADVDLIYGNYQLIDVDGNVVTSVYPINWNQWLFAHGRFVPLQPTVFWRRRVYEAVGDLDETLHYCMDVDFFARASRQFKFAKIDATLGQFRIHNASKTQNSANARKVYCEHKQVLRKNYKYDFFDAIIFDLFYYRSFLTRTIHKK